MRAMERVTKQDLVAQIVAAGCARPSNDLLRRLAREGLLQRPRQRHPGRTRGSVTEYPSQAVRQAVGVLRLHTEVHRFVNLRFWAFWEGLWVESRILRQTLARWLGSFLASTSKTEDPFELAEKLAFGPHTEDIGGKFGIRNPEDVKSGVFALFLGSMGGDPDWDFQPLQETTHQVEDTKTPTELTRHMLNLKELTEPVGDFGALVEEIPEPQQILGDLAQTDLGNPGRWNDAIMTVPLTELTAARDTARTLGEDFVFIADTAEQFGLGVFPASVTRGLRAPQGRSAAAIRHRVRTIGLALAINRLDQQQTVKQSLGAFTQAAQEMKDALAAATADT